MRLYEQKETWKYMPLGRIITMVIEAIDSKSRVKCKNDKSYVPKNKLCLHWYAKSNDCYVTVIHWSLRHLSWMLFSRSFLSTSSYFIIYRITLLFLYALVRFNLRQIQFTHSSDRSRVRKHETQSYRESCVFHFSHFELYIYLYMYVCVYIYIYICICNN